MAVKDELVKSVGSKYVTDDPKVLEDYSRDHSLTSPGKAFFVFYVSKTEDVQGIVKLCNEHRIPLIPSSSRVHFRGGTIPKQGGIIIDFKRMNKILSVNDRNRYVMIEPGGGLAGWNDFPHRFSQRSKFSEDFCGGNKPYGAWDSRFLQAPSGRSGHHGYRDLGPGEDRIFVSSKK